MNIGRLVINILAGALTALVYKPKAGAATASS